MKKIFLSLVLLSLTANYLKAQDDAVIQLYVTTKKYEDAKKLVDKWLAEPKIKDKDKQSALLWKMLVYSELFYDSSLTQKYPDAFQQSADALNQYIALEPSLKQLKDQHFEGGVGNLYSGAFNKGRDFFQEKKWDSSFKYFSESQGMGDFLLKNKLSTSNASVDTVTVLYTGYAAQNARYLDSAAKYYTMLTDIKIGGPDYEDIYKFLVEYYTEKKDADNLKKTLDLAKQLYPADNSLWTQYEMNALTTNSNLMELLQKYQSDAAAGNMNEEKLISYAEALATNDKAQLDNLDSLQKITIKLAAAQAFQKAFEIANTDGIYAFNAGVIYYSIFSDLDDRFASYRGEGAALKAKRDEVTKLEAAYADTAGLWLEKAYTNLKAKQDREKSETSSLNRAVDYLANIYYWKRDQTKTNGNAGDYDKYDALYKQFDSEHASYK